MAKRGQPDDPGTTEDPENNAQGWTTDSVSEALREAGRRAVELSGNPAARALFAAGLAAAAAAIASNKNVRDATRRNIKEAQEATGAAFENVTENANKIGAAIVNSAIEAVQTLMKTGAAPAGAAEAKPQAAASAPAPAPASKPAQPKAAAKPRANAAAAKPSTAKAAPQRAAKSAAKDEARAKPRARRKKAGDAPAG